MMKRISMLFLLLVGGVVAVAFFFWHQATKLPEWYTKNQTQSIANVMQAAAEVEQKVKTQTHHSRQAGQPNNVEVQLSEGEVNHLVIAKMLETIGQTTLPTAFKGIHTQIQPDRIKTGAVVDLAELQTSDLGSQEKALLAELTQAFPAIANRKLYVGLEGKPIVDNGHLRFDQSTRVQVGDLSLTLEELANHLGVPQATLQERIDLRLRLGDLQVWEAELKNGGAVIKGAAK